MKPMECKGWNELARNLVIKCYKKGIINFKENESLSQIQYHKKTITICSELLKDENLENVYFDEMKTALKEGINIEIPNIYDDIRELGGLFITTNADTHFDRLFIPSNILYRDSDFKEDRLDRINLYHIHGSILDRNSLIFTVPEYMKRYTNTDFIRFLKQIFLKYTVLFLGYGIEEFEILEFMFKNVEKPKKHFMLYPFYKGEDNILRIEQKYYSSFNIDIIGFEKDDNGYDQLIEVIKKWKEEIRQVTGYLNISAQRIDAAVDGIAISAKEISNTLQTIRNDKSLEDYFFKKLAEASKPLEWLVSLRDARYFDPEKNPRPQETPDKKSYIIPYWNILETLNNMAVKNEENPNDEVSKVLIDIVDGIITYRENGIRIGNYNTDWKLLITISHFPIKYLGSQHIQFIKDALRPSIGTSLLDTEIDKLFLPKLIKKKARDLIVGLLDVILDYSISNKGYIREYISVIDSYYLREVLKNNKKGISEICAVEAANIAITKMQEILKEDKSQFNNIWIPAIEDHEQTSFPDRYDCQIVHFVRDMFEAADPKEIEYIVKDMLTDKHDIFKRLAYHLINHHYDTLSRLLWSITYNPLNSLTIHELYELFKEHCKIFDKFQIKTVLNWIETKEYYFSDEVSSSPEKENILKAYYKKEWLLALRDSGNEEVEKRYESYNSINDAKIEHPGFHHWSSGVRRVQDISPIDEDEFKKMTNTEIAEYINAYKEKDKTSWRGDFTEINLASSIRKFISNNQVKFSMNLAPFLSIPRKYQYEILRGLEEAWNNKRDFNWNELLPFMEKLIENDNFWIEEKQDNKNDYKSWIVNTIAQLIEEGTKDDKHAFSPDLLPIAEEIILTLIKNVKSDMSITNDFINSVLNSTKGTVFEAAVNYSLRYARLYCENKNERWVESIKSEFTERLDKTKEPGLEFSIIIGWYLPFLNYLDKQWVVSNFNRIFDLKSDRHWEAAFTGYIVMTSTVYEEIYKLLRDNGHYEKGLSWSFSNENATENFVRNIVIGYIAGWDNLADANGLLNKLLNTNNVKYISEIVTFMWTFRDRNDEALKQKIKPLWKVIIDKVTSNIEKDGYRNIALNLEKWLSLVDTIDNDVYDWLTKSIEAVDIKENWSSGFFIEYLRKHVVKTPTEVGKLYLKMLDSGTYPDYKKEDIIAIVQALYDSNEIETATRIYNLYFSKGFEFLRETFKNNEKKLKKNP